MPTVKRVHADFRAVADHKEAHKANARNRAIPLDKGAEVEAEARQRAADRN